MTLASWPHFNSNQIDSAIRVLASGKVNSWTGQETAAFETEFANWCGTSYAIAIANGSLALSSSYLAIGLSLVGVYHPPYFHRHCFHAVLLGANRCLLM